MRAAISIAAGFLFLICAGCCPCTEKDCPDGVYIILESPSGEDFPDGELLVRWEIGDASGEVTSKGAYFNYFAYEPNQLDFYISHCDIAGTRLKSIEQEEITFEIFYGDRSTGLGGAHPLDWETEICNRCGDAPWCEDQKVSAAFITVTVDESDWPFNGSQVDGGTGEDAGIGEDGGV